MYILDLCVSTLGIHRSSSEGMQVIDQPCNLPVKWALLEAKLHLFSPAREKYAIYLLAGAEIPDIIQHESWRERSFSTATRFPVGIFSCATPSKAAAFL